MNRTTLASEILVPKAAPAHIHHGAHRQADSGGFARWSDYTSHMSTTRRSISVTELKARLSEQLRRVKAGESVLITERGRPIGMMTPLPGKILRDDLADLAEAGLVRLAMAKSDGELLEEDRPEDPEASVREALLEERRASR